MAAVALKGEILSLKDDSNQRDFPVVCRDKSGKLRFAYIDHDGTSDVLWLGQKSDGQLKAQIAVSEPGIVHQGIIEAFRARRTIAATDKIYLEFLCNGQPLGAIFESKEAPKLSIKVDGTAPLKRVTLVRNEENYQVFDGISGKVFDTTLTDEEPVVGEEARYYLRVEQTDGNMAWS